MGGFRRNKHEDGKGGDKGGDPKPPQKTPLPKTPLPETPPLRSPVDDLYDTGDIAAPAPDRDDEQRDL